jgi:hypothetical protein
MTGLVRSGNYLHDQACAVAEGVRQATVAGATMNAAGQVTVNNAEIAWARAIIASCKANNSGAGAEAFQSLLRALGTGGI